MKLDRLRDGGVAIIALVGLIALVAVTSRHFMGSSDNAVEEALEEHTESLIGIKPDYSPDTPDPDHE